MDDSEKQSTIENVTARIIAQHPDAPRLLIANLVEEKYDELAFSRIRTYIPILVEREATNRITREIASRIVDEI